MSLPKPSEEQNAVVDAIKDFNVIVDSVAGSGKTTTILHIANKHATPSSHVLILTYNHKLRVETEERIKKLGVENVYVYTYHKFGMSYYLTTDYTRQRHYEYSQ